MIFYLRLALRNALRKPVRTVITASSVVIGVSMIILAWAFLDGLDSAIIDGQVHCDSGHFRIAAKGFFENEEEAGLDWLIEDPEQAMALLRAAGDFRLYPRLTFPGRLSDGRYSTMASGVGIDPASTFAEFRLPMKQRLDPRKQDGLGPIWLGANLAKSFGFTVGDSLTLLARTRYGSFTADEYRVAGLIESQNPAIDNLKFFLPLEVVQELLDAEGAVTEVVGFASSRSRALELPELLGRSLEKAGLELQTWFYRAEPILKINQMRRKIFGVIIGIIMLIAASSIANTVVMSCFERVREIGTLRALGFQKSGIAGLLLAETLFIGLLGSAVGGAAGAGLVFWLRDGLDLSGLVSGGDYGVSFSAVIYFELTFSRIAWAFLLGLVVTTLSALYPALKFSGLSPSEAMRS